MREKSGKRIRKAVLEAQKADEFFEKKSLELAKKYDELFLDFEKEKEAFIEERKQYQELLQMERDKMDRETEHLEKSILEDEREKILGEHRKKSIVPLRMNKLKFLRWNLKCKSKDLKLHGVMHNLH